MRRIFIAIPLQDTVTDRLSQVQKEYPELPAKWVKPENLHITLAFLGNRSDEEIGEICSTIKEIAQNHSPFTLIFKNIVYGPPEKTPRMIWATGNTTTEFTLLVKEIQQALLESKTTITLHITLARINQWELQKISEEEQLNVSKEINIKVPVESIVVMESRLKRGGAEYTILQEATLQ